VTRGAYFLETSLFTRSQAEVTKGKITIIKTGHSALWLQNMIVPLMEKYIFLLSF
jgi:hypothetical protein